MSDLRSGIIVLGAGPEIDRAVREIYNSDIPLLAYGCHESNRQNANETIGFCNDNDIPVLSGHSEIPLKGLNPRYIFMMSYPPLISEQYLSKYDFVNTHGALIPKYRGMHGGTWAIINGEEEHGYSIHKVDSGIDSGPVYYQGKVKSILSDDVNTIRKRILDHFKENILEVLQKIYNREIEAIPQDEDVATFVCRRRPEDGVIDWNNKAMDIHNMVRALTPPYTQGAFTFYKGEKLFISKTAYLNRPEYIGINGQVVERKKGQSVLVKCGDTYLSILEVIFRGVKQCPTELFRTVGVRLGV